MAKDSHRSNDADRKSLPQDERKEVIDLLSRNGLHPESQAQKPARENMPFIMVLLKRRLHILPIITFIVIVAGFFTSYSIAVYHGHAEADFPYISYTAIYAPERCIFSLIINLGAFLLAANIYIKYLEMKVAYRRINTVSRDRILNKIALITGFISAFGLSMVANFQTVDARVGHYIGAGLTFIGGIIYCWMQTALSIRYRRWSCIAVGQLVMSIVLSFSLVIFSVSKAIYKIQEAQGVGTKTDKLRVVYLISTISEWVTAVSLVSFVLTFFKDFRGLSLHLPKIEFTDYQKIAKDYVVRGNGQAVAPVMV
ncbi:DNA damage-regulated autophagy modulator protein 1 [Biomphalaria glabrata]|nr:DNA damage-regulated autophagy modulator protein 1-like [Biomphalaria glabrata]